AFPFASAASTFILLFPFFFSYLFFTHYIKPYVFFGLPHDLYFILWYGSFILFLPSAVARAALKEVC
ncbi:MAG: hypothetical protein N2V72_05575, partial [Methanophagales archaeon]|nr:hypothetical protein [Methanophagales archaeon]